MKIFLLTIGLITLLILSCEKDKIISKEINGLEISIGSMCGWCAGADSLLMTEEKTHYEYFSPCDENDYFKDTLTKKEDWNELIGQLDMEKFQNIEINTCYVCVDGCDTWINVQDSSVSHTIRFGYTDTIVIKDIRPFVDKLDSIRTRFRNN